MQVAPFRGAAFGMPMPRPSEDSERRRDVLQAGIRCLTKPMDQMSEPILHRKVCLAHCAGTRHLPGQSDVSRSGLCTQCRACLPLFAVTMLIELPRAIPGQQSPHTRQRTPRAWLQPPGNTFALTRHAPPKLLTSAVLECHRRYESVLSARCTATSR